MSLLISLTLSVQSLLFSQNVVINEFLSSNDSGLLDIDGDLSDWIELHNLEDTEISMLGYTLSDDSDTLDKWEFPDIAIPADGYLLIFASNKDMFVSNELHSNFKISQTGEPLFLSNELGEIISQTDATFVPADHSAARISDDIAAMTISSVPTPNAMNFINEGIYSSHVSGFYDEGFDLELVDLNGNYEIYYTLNGELPSSNSNLYTAPISIENNSQTPYSISDIPTTPLSGPDRLNDYIWKEPESVYKSNVVRFAAFQDGEIKGSIYSKTFFVDPEIEDRYDFPIISFITDSLNLFDHDTGIYVPGERFDQVGFNWWPEGNYHNRGELWERDVHISFFENDGTIGFETDAGIRMRGYSSASFPQKSFNLYFRSEYGMPRIEYPVFNSFPNETHKRLILRNGGNDFLQAHFRDAMLQEIMSTMDLEKQDFQPSVLFINGEYWGVYNIREKYDEFYFRYKYGKEDVNILGICGAVEEGTNIDYVNLIDFVEQNDLSIEANYNFVSSKMDIANFIDFQIAEIYFANGDWPCNNFKIWKDNEPDSKWRFLIYDLDNTFGSDANNTFMTQSMEHATSTQSGWPYCECSNLLFRTLLMNEKFREQFLERFTYHLSNTFCTNEVLSKINEFELLYVNEIEEYIDRWHYPGSVNAWGSEVDVLREFARERPSYMKFNLISYFDLSEFRSECEGDTDIFNEGLTLYPNPNTGQFLLYNGSSEDIQGANISLSNLFGQVVYEQNNAFIAEKQNLFFEFDDLSSGIYIFTVENSDKKISKKVFIE